MQNDIQIYRQTITQLNPKVTAEEWDYFESGLVIEQYQPKSFYMEAGKKNHQLGFVTSGLIRGYYMNDLGEDTTVTFEKEGG